MFRTKINHKILPELSLWTEIHLTHLSVISTLSYRRIALFTDKLLRDSRVDFRPTYRIKLFSFLRNILKKKNENAKFGHFKGDSHEAKAGLRNR
jgi:hypothetical protein